MKVAKITIKKSNIYDLCVRQQYYTCGDGEAYANMLAYVDKQTDIQVDMLVDVMFAIANDIYEHSDIEKMQAEYGCSEEECLQAIYFEVGRCVEFHLEEVRIYD